MNYGRRLRERRKAVGLTMMEVVKRAGLSQAYLSQLETGKNEPAVWERLVKLARVYETSTDYLLGLTDDPAPANGRDLPLYGAEVLAMMRELPNIMRHVVLEHTRVTYEAHKIEGERFPLASLFAELYGQELYDEFAEQLRVIAASRGREAAFEYLESRLDDMIGGAEQNSEFG